ncbi:MAG: hypothetical protein WBF58_03725 [Xanthobacteraceae bacterium]
MPLPRTLYAVPQTMEKWLDIIDAFRTLAGQDDERIRQRRAEIASIRRELGEIAQQANKFFRQLLLPPRRELRKTGFNPDEPRVPEGTHGGGEWTSAGGSAPSTTPESDGIPGRQYAANERPGTGHNQGPPLEEPPEIPPEEPATAQLRNAFLKAAARWLAKAGLEAIFGGPAGDYLVALQTAAWLHEYLPYITAYLQPPKTFAELQQDALNPQRGYDIHHVVEQTPAEQDGFPDSMINAPDNLVRIPTLKHWQINAWYSTKNNDFGSLSPRNYLRGRSWDERVRVGTDALILFGVLQP